ncbi:MAG: 3-isopropylmalate dehydratase small subunit [Patescibacteria group bacterium]|nr:3-isopropylmalate dehydratase small subunit [Patescibacteria group bacterium]
MKAKIHFYKRDNINTDEIIPARYLNCDNEAELAKHAMEDIDKDFTQNVQQGDFIIAGKDFGCGSSREHAIWALRGAGVKGIIAKSFARIFYRNAINNGFLAIECSELNDDLKTGDEIEVNLEQGFFTVNDKKYNFSPIPEFVKKIMDKKGLLNTIE